MEKLLQAKRQLIEGLKIFTEFKSILEPIDLNGEMTKKLDEAIDRNLSLLHETEKKLKKLGGEDE